MSANAFLVDAQLRHQIMVQRLSGGIWKDVDPVLKRMRDSIVSRLASEPTDFQITRLNMLMADVNGMLKASLGEFSGQLQLELEDFAEYETGFQGRMLGGVINVDTVLPPVEQVVAAFTSKPAELITGGRVTRLTIPDMMRQFSDKKGKEIMGLVRAGFIEGQTTDQIARQVSQRVTKRTRAQARALVRTATNHAGSVARSETMAANADVLEGEEWVSTLDSKTSQTCFGLSGNIYPVGSGPYPPAHYNCLSGDTLVSTCSSVSNIYKRRYKGTMVNITTKAGRSLKITPNHPVLTLRGWVPAGEINRSDKLIPVDAINVDMGEHYKDSVEATFSDLFSAFDVSVESSLVRNSPTSAEDFHGDRSADSEVEVISVDRFARKNVTKVFFKNIQNKGFIPRSIANLALHSFGSSVKRRHAFLAATGSIMGFLRKPGYFLGTGVRHAEELLFGFASKLASGFSEVCHNRGSGTIEAQVAMDSACTNTAIIGSKDVDLLRFGKLDEVNWGYGDSVGVNNSLNRLIADSELFSNPAYSPVFDRSKADYVVDLFFSEVDCHVYNLENDDNWYASNGIITHNCRSVRVPKVKPEFSLFKGGSTRPAIGDDGVEQISTRKTFGGWLRGQPDSFQDEFFGKFSGGATKRRLFKEGRLDPQQFIDPNGVALSLDELRRLEPQAFERAGL